MGLLLDVLVLVDHLLIDILLGSEGSLALLNFTDSLFSKGLLILRAGSLNLLDIFKGNTLNGSFLSEDFLLLVLASIGLFQFLVESAPGSGPS